MKPMYRILHEVNTTNPNKGGFSCQVYEVYPRVYYNFNSREAATRAEAIGYADSYLAGDEDTLHYAVQVRVGSYYKTVHERFFTPADQL